MFATFVVGVYGGYFTAAQGILLIGAMGALLPEDMQRMNAAKNLLALVVNVVAAVAYTLVAFDRISWVAAGLIAVGSLVGGFLGAHYGRRLSPNALRAFDRRGRPDRAVPAANRLGWGRPSAVGFRPAAGDPGQRRAVAQFGSALDWGSSGRRFKSCQPDTRKPALTSIGAGFCLSRSGAESPRACQELARRRTACQPDQPNSDAAAARKSSGCASL